jgi:hypothetical protein
MILLSVTVDLVSDELTVHYVADTDVVEVEMYSLLRGVLPARAVPRRWVRHGAIPTNASGKTDYRTLLAG